jgi:CAAX protease family protein
MNREAGHVQRRPVVAFFVVVTALTIPFWILDVVTGIEIVPGVPFSGFGVLLPAATAAIFLYRERGWGGVAALMKTLRIGPKIWLLPAALTVPAILLLSYLVLRLSGVAVPPPEMSLPSILGLAVAFLVGATGEELGWSGYVSEPLQARFGFLPAAVYLGLYWAAWHFLGLAHAGRSLTWIAWWTLGTLSLRVLFLWLFNKSGKSVLTPVLAHASYNLAWQLFPINGSYYDPRTASILMALVAFMIIMLERPRRQARYELA